MSTETRRRLTTRDYLELIGVRDLPPLTSPFDPGYDLVTLEGHLDQSAHLMASLKISMACWLIADEGITRRKIAAAQAHNVRAVTGGGPFEIALAQGRLDDYLDLCADVGVTRIECGEGFTTLALSPQEIVGMHGVARPGGYVFVRGELWRARTDDGEIAPGEQARFDVALERRIEDVEGVARGLVFE